MHRSLGFVVRRAAGSAVMLAIGVVVVAEGLPSRPAAAATPSISPRLHQKTLTALDSQEVLAKDVALVSVKAVASPRQASPSVRRPAPARAQMPVARRPVPTPSRVRGGRTIFPYGQCTWYVAQRRFVPWRGNAWQWWWNARAYGFREGWRPQVGAIMVSGYSWSSPWGHVAYVERVYSDGSFLVSEMNWWGVRGGGWGRVDYRVIRSMRGVLGFIY